MNATGKRRLLKLADFLETVAPKRFDMSKWADGEKDGRPACKTAACALGWATAIPSFRHAGLHLVPSTGTAEYRTRFPVEPRFETSRAVSAGARFFGLAHRDARSLFNPWDVNDLKGARGRRIVAKRIRDLVASERKRAA